jgi:ABC-type transporter Mla subunit MlaD
MKRFKNELWVAALLLLAVLAGISLYQNAVKPAEKKYYLLANELSGFKTDHTPVTIRGLRAGEIVKAEVAGNKVLLTLKIQKKFKIMRPATALAEPNSLFLPGPVLEIIPDSSSGVYYQPGDTIYGLQFSKTTQESLLQRDIIALGLIVKLVKNISRAFENTNNIDSIIRR